MNLIIAFCTDATVFNNNQIFNKDCIDKYPGSRWVSQLANLASDNGLEVLTGDLVISKLKAKEIKASNVLIVQEENAYHGKILIELGAIPLAIFCLESPLFVSGFYALLKNNTLAFKNRILFRGAMTVSLTAGLNYPAYFPSYNLKELTKNSIPWSNRKFLVMVAANKYWKIRRNYFRSFIARLRDFILQKKSYLTQDIINSQLHDKRLELIDFFGRNESIDLYGSGWTNLQNLPNKWKKLESIITKLNPVPCNNKNEVISEYKFVLCFENMSYPGYVTEKIIDCLKAGVIPIYMGAPDITDFVPKSCFIDLREFDDYAKLLNFLQNLSPEVAEKMLESGFCFLQSEQGTRFTYENFAKNILEMAKEFK